MPPSSVNIAPMITPHSACVWNPSGSANVPVWERLAALRPRLQAATRDPDCIAKLRTWSAAPGKFSSWEDFLKDGISTFKGLYGGSGSTTLGLNLSSCGLTGTLSSLGLETLSELEVSVIALQGCSACCKTSVPRATHLFTYPFHLSNEHIRRLTSVNSGPVHACAACAPLHLPLWV